MTHKKPQVGVSQCLLGNAVRYDGKSKGNVIVIEQLSKIFELIAVCPEVEAGLSIPRHAIQLSGCLKNPQLIGRNDPSINVTDIMQNYCRDKPVELNYLQGFIFKSHSPSCGLNSTPVFIDSKCVTETSRGVFARSLCEHYPQLAVIEDNTLDNQNQLDRFIKNVYKQVRIK